MGRFALDDDDLVPALMLIALAALACLLPAQADTFYHLRSGREMWDTGHLLSREPFSWTAFGQPLPNHWWLSQLVFYGVFAAGGPVALSVLTGACAFAALLISWRMVTGSMEVRLLALVALVSTLPEWSVRPQAFSLLFFAVVLRLIAADRLKALPLLLVLWANMHAVVVLGVAAAGAVVLDAVVWDRSRLRRASAIAALSAAAPVVSPLGIHYWPWLLRTVAVSRTLELSEYRSLATAGIPGIPAVVLVVAFIVVVARARRRLRDCDRPTRVMAVLALLLAPAAATSMRNVAFFALAAVPAMSMLLPAARRRRARPAAPAASGIIGIAAVIALVVVVVRWRDGGAALGWRPMSPAAIAAVRACPSPLYNSMYEGGALMWFVPDRRVFMDGRVDVYPLPLLERGRRADLFGDYQALFADYGIRCAVVARQSPMSHALSRDPSMSLRFRDDAWTVFARVTSVAGTSRAE